MQNLSKSDVHYFVLPYRHWRFFFIYFPELHTSLTSNDRFNKFKIQNDQATIINLLLEYGANRSCKNHQNQTPAILLSPDSPVCTLHLVIFVAVLAYENLTFYSEKKV